MVEYQKVEVVGEAGSTPIAKGKTTIFKRTAATANTVTVHTVTAGKVFYLTGAHLSMASNVTETAAFMLIDAVLVMSLNATVTAGTWDRDRSDTSLALATPLPFPAGTLFRVKSDNGGMSAILSIFGWEDDA